jgi:hypothetical protein
METKSPEIDDFNAVYCSRSGCTQAQFYAAVESICITIQLLQGKLSGPELALALEILRREYALRMKAAQIV